MPEFSHQIEIQNGTYDDNRSRISGCKNVQAFPQFSDDPQSTLSNKKSVNEGRIHTLPPLEEKIVIFWDKISIIIEQCPDITNLSITQEI